LLNVRVTANSPSLCPTMFSLTSTGTCCLPLCTAMVNPTMSGMTMERRDQVLIGRLLLLAIAVSTFFTRWWSMNGPFFRERAMTVYILIALPLLAPTHDELLRALVVACLVALGRRAPRRHRMASTGGAAFAT